MDRPRTASEVSAKLQNRRYFSRPGYVPKVTEYSTNSYKSRSYNPDFEYRLKNNHIYGVGRSGNATTVDLVATVGDKQRSERQVKSSRRDDRICVHNSGYITMDPHITMAGLYDSHEYTSLYEYFHAREYANLHEYKYRPYDHLHEYPPYRRKVPPRLYEEKTNKVAPAPVVVVPEETAEEEVEEKPEEQIEEKPEEKIEEKPEEKIEEQPEEPPEQVAEDDEPIIPIVAAAAVASDKPEDDVPTEARTEDDVETVKADTQDIQAERPISANAVVAAAVVGGATVAAVESGNDQQPAQNTTINNTTTETNTTSGGGGHAGAALLAGAAIGAAAASGSNNTETATESAQVDANESARNPSPSIAAVAVAGAAVAASAPESAQAPPSEQPDTESETVAAVEAPVSAAVPVAAAATTADANPAEDPELGAALGSIQRTLDRFRFN